MLANILWHTINPHQRSCLVLYLLTFFTIWLSFVHLGHRAAVKISVSIQSFISSARSALSLFRVNLLMQSVEKEKRIKSFLNPKGWENIILNILYIYKWCVDSWLVLIKKKQNFISIFLKMFKCFKFSNRQYIQQLLTQDCIKKILSMFFSQTYFQEKEKCYSLCIGFFYQKIIMAKNLWVI